MSEQIKVTIIIPVYNVPENALRQCLESTIRQTMSEIEIIIIDDGSTDNSGFICDDYSAMDSRIQVIHKKNEGLSAARNTGYNLAHGQWVTFLDSDDWIEPTMCEDTYMLGEKENVDIVIFGTIQEFEHYKRKFSYHYTDGQVFLDDECRLLQTEILNFTGNIATAWAKLIRKSVLDNHQIEHNATLRQGSEGIEFNIRLFEHIKKAVFTNKVYYHYIYNPNSISAKHDEKNHYYVIKCFEEIYHQIQKSPNKEHLMEKFYERFTYVIISAAIGGYFSPSNPQPFCEKKKSFQVYIHSELVKKTVHVANISAIGLFRLIAFYAIKFKCYRILELMANIRYIQKRGGKK